MTNLRVKMKQHKSMQIKTKIIERLKSTFIFCHLRSSQKFVMSKVVKYIYEF